MEPLKLAASRPDRHIHPQPRRMHFPHMLIHRGSSLRAPIALGVVEIKRVYGEFTDGALKCKAAV